MHQRLPLFAGVLLSCAAVLAIPSRGSFGNALQTSLPTTPSWVVEGDQVSAQLGQSVAGAGDVNGDGIADVIVGAPGYLSGGVRTGAAFVFLGTSAGPQLVAAWRAEGTTPNESFGSWVSSAGDVNGDGFSDVIVGAPTYPAGGTDRGRALLYLGSATGLSAIPSWTLEGEQDGLRLGVPVASAGDVNGDGYDDVLIGLPNFDGGETHEGQVRLYLGSASGLGTTPAWASEPDTPFADFGKWAASAGDVDGDGHGDVIIGAPSYRLTGWTGSGRAYLYLGSPSGLGSTPSWTFSDSVDGGGSTVAGAGDVNGDGYDDILVGSPFQFNGNLYPDGRRKHEGRAFLFLGAAGGPASSPAWSAAGTQDLSSFGAPVAGAGDVDGDGYDDFLVAAFSYSDPATPALDAGAVFLYSGSATVPIQTWNVIGERDNRLGASIAGAADTDGDLLANFLVGIPGFSSGESAEGAAFLYFGPIASPCPDQDGDGYGSPGSLTCTGGSVEDCDDANPAIHPGASERCNGIDDDCDGSVDEGWPLGGTCSVGLGLCATSGTIVCDPSGTSTVCNAPPPGAPSPEVCDGLDNDCDGAVDDDLDDPASCRITVSSQSNTHLGWSVSGAGDINGDGFSDVLVGHPLAFISTPLLGPVGAALLFLGSPNGAFGSPAHTILYPSSPPSGSFPAFGSAVAAAGDVNGDGLGDFLVSAPNHSNDVFTEGKGVAYLYLGDASGLPIRSPWFAMGAGYGANLGSALAGVGDVDHDGHDDVLIGAPGRAQIPGTSYSRNAYLYKGTATGLSVSPSWAASENSIWRFGSSVAASDFDGDDHVDLIIGAPSTASARAGRAEVYRGIAGAFPATPTWSLRSPGGDESFGWSVAAAGDINGDGFQDLLIGAPGLSSGDFGRAYVYLGSAVGPGATPGWTQIGSAAGDKFGSSVAGAGDVNRDGYADILIGAPGDSGSGRTFLFLGAPSGPGSMPAWSRSTGDQPGSLSGFSVASAGDYNGDRVPDAIIGTPYFNTGSVPRAGRADLEINVCPGTADTDADGVADVCDWCPYGGEPNLDRNGNGVPDCTDPSVFDATIDFSAPAGKGSGLVSWLTTFEDDLVGFNIVVIDSQGNHVLLNGALIPCEECVTRAGHSYSYVVPKHRSGRNIFIEAVRSSGRILYGPAVRK